MPLIIDPSSTCDICLENYSLSRRCHSIPCGHVFCSQCLSQIQGYTCPICRANIYNMALQPREFGITPKLHVDFAPSNPSTPPSGMALTRTQKEIEKLEDELTESLKNKITTVQDAVDIAQKVDTFLKDRPTIKYRSLDIIRTLSTRLSRVMAKSYERASLDKATKASYETRIRELEQSLREMKIRSKENRRPEPAGNRSNHHATQSTIPALRSRLKNATSGPEVTVG